MKKILFLLCVCWALSSLPAQVRALTPQQKQILAPGTVFRVPLTDFAGPGDQKPYHLLESGHETEAIQGFKKKLAANKEDLAAFVGLAQADPSGWPLSIAQLERQAKSGDNYKVDFKLGVLYLYQWEVDRSTYPKQLDRSWRLLTQAWEESRQPIIGLFYAQMQNKLAPGVTEISSVLDQLISDLAGQRSAEFYQYARHSHWRGLTPPVQETPVENLKPLRSVLHLAWSFSGARMGHGVMHGNNIVSVMDPLTPEQEKNMAYLLKWRKAVDRAIAAHKLS